MFDHLVLNVKDIAASRAFYEKALAPLSYSVISDFGDGIGFSEAGKPAFWIALREPQHTDVHVAFQCKERAPVDAFYAAAMEAGGKDHGPPGIREDYGPNYYGAFVLDPDGNNIEAVCHREES